MLVLFSFSFCLTSRFAVFLPWGSFERISCITSFLVLFVASLHNRFCRILQRRNFQQQARPHYWLKKASATGCFRVLISVKEKLKFNYKFLLFSAPWQLFILDLWPVTFICDTRQSHLLASLALPIICFGSTADLNEPENSQILNLLWCVLSPMLNQRTHFLLFPWNISL